ncbi:MAG: class I SAM-dependent methyltransferase [Candidatus Dormibacteria bacterium]
MPDTRDWRAVFDRTFAGPVSAVHARAWQQVYGEEYPAELDTYSYVTRSELRDLATELGAGPGDLVLDAGCGRGGPGLWVAAETGASLVGIDIAPSAVAGARDRAARIGLAAVTTYRVGTFEATGLDPGSCTAAMSIDALLFTPDKALALHELARVLRPGGRLVFTSWDYHAQPVGRPPQVDDHRPLLSAAGFDVLRYEETANWRTHLRRSSALLLDAVDELAAETGESPEVIRSQLEEMAATEAAMSRRVLVVARRG